MILRDILHMPAVAAVWHNPCLYRDVMKNSSTQPPQARTDDAPEAEAIRAVCNGDSDAFEHLYKLHGRRVYSLCLRLTGDPAEAEDLTQEAILQMFRKIHTFRGEARFSTWLHRLTVNVVLAR